MITRRAAIGLVILLAFGFVMALPVHAQSTYTVQINETVSCIVDGLSTTCPAMTLTDGGATLGSKLIAITEPLTNCHLGGALVPCSPLTLAESFSQSVSNTITTITRTITQWITTTVSGTCNSCTVATDTPFDATLTTLVIPGITLAMYLSIAFALKVRSFPIIVLFGAVALMSMAAFNIVPGWTILIIVIVLSGATAQTLGHIAPMNPLYGTMMFLLLLGVFIQIYAAGTPTLTNPSSQVQSPSLPCIGDIFGYCIVSDIINGLSSALSIAGDLGGNPVNVAVGLGFLFLVVGVVAGIFGFGSLMNVVFSVGLSISIFYFINAELAQFSSLGMPNFMYLLFNAVIGVADLYMFREAFSGVGGGGGGKVGTTSSSGAGAKAPVE